MLFGSRGSDSLYVNFTPWSLEPETDGNRQNWRNTVHSKNCGDGNDDDDDVGGDGDDDDDDDDGDDDDDDHDDDGDDDNDDGDVDVLDITSHFVSWDRVQASGFRLAFSSWTMDCMRKR